MFGAHGEFTITSEPPRMYIKLKDSFNSEGIALLTQGAKQELSTLPAGVIKYVVVDLAEFEFFTADSLPALESYFQGVQSRGYQRVDYINANSLTESLFKRLWRGSKIEVNFYSSTQSYLQHHPDDSYMAEQALS